MARSFEQDWLRLPRQRSRRTGLLSVSQKEQLNPYGLESEYEIREDNGVLTVFYVVYAGMLLSVCIDEYVARTDQTGRALSEEFIHLVVSPENTYRIETYFPVEPDTDTEGQLTFVFPFPLDTQKIRIDIFVASTVLLTEYLHRGV